MTTWKQVLDQEGSKEYYQQLARSIAQEAEQFTIYPKRQDLFNALKLCSLDQVKVLILGQDPYHGTGQAHGLSFSVPLECDIPPSLRNIFREINSDLQTQISFPHGCLTNWAKQGVLLLNSILTVRENQAGSHRNLGWETFTDRLIQVVEEQDRPIVFLLWGNFARSKKSFIKHPQHLVLEAAHPSPLSAYNGFFGCKHFSKSNDFLCEVGIGPIHWNII